MTKAKTENRFPTHQIAQQKNRESLRQLLRDLIERHGAPSAKEIQWAERALGGQPQRRARA